MKYTEARPKIQNGDIVFVRGEPGFFKRPVQNLIMFFTKSKYTHVGIAFWVNICGQDRLMMVESQVGAKRRILNMSFYQRRELDVIEAPREWQGMCVTATERLGQVNYGYLDAIYVGLRERLAKYIALPHKNFQGEICSELIARLLGFEEVNISPQKLWDQLMKTGARVRLVVR